MDGIEVKQIDFDTLVAYWKEVNHFNDPDKKYRLHVKKLGPFTTEYENPRIISYGLFDTYWGSGQMIGATQLVEWKKPSTIRFRTINIRKEYRHQDLGWYLLEEAHAMDWPAYDKLFGWMALRKLDWALDHGFEVIEGSEQNNHIGVIKEM